MSATQQIPASRPLDALAAVGTSVWLDSLSRGLIETGELERLVTELGVAGVTANPSIFAKAKAIRRATAAGVNVNVTLLFAVDAYEQAADAYLAGLEDRVARGEPVGDVASVASFFVSRVDTAVDRVLAERGRDDLAGRAGIANARVAYGRFRELFSGERFARLATRGAQVQRPLWASTGVKDERYRDVMYVEELAGPDTVDTMPPATLAAFADHGRVRDALTGSEGEARRTLAELRDAGVALDAMTARLLGDGIDAFEAAMRELLAAIA